MKMFKNVSVFGLKGWGIAVAVLALVVVGVAANYATAAFEDKLQAARESKGAKEPVPVTEPAV